LKNSNFITFIFDLLIHLTITTKLLITSSNILSIYLIQPLVFPFFIYDIYYLNYHFD